MKTSQFMQNENHEYKLGASAIVVSGDKYLLIKRGKEPSKGMYSFPGGHVEPGERLEAAAIRELEEETNLIGHNARQFAQYDLSEKRPRFMLHVFLVDVLDTHGAVAGDDAADLGWYTYDEANALPLTNNVAECLTKLEFGTN
ncbi:MAG: NUDIX hydrolase [Lentilitoribacter sp.]